MIRLKHCVFFFQEYGSLVIFNDGTSSSNWPPLQDQAKLIRIALDCGFKDLVEYIQEHDFSHAFIAEKFFDAPSPVLWAAAHNKEVVLDPIVSLYEERWVYHWQRFVRDMGPPLEDGWREGREEYLSLLENIG